MSTSAYHGTRLVGQRYPTAVQYSKQVGLIVEVGVTVTRK